MRDDSAFDAVGPVLLRAAVLPLPGTNGGRGPGADSGRAPDADPGEPGAQRAEVARMVGDPVFMAAVELASPSLAGEARRVAAGEPVKDRRLRRLVVSLVKYRLRMTYRATPFGFFAGVALAAFGPEPAQGLGTGHRSVSRPDAAWLDAVLDTLLPLPGVLDRTRLVANTLRTERDGRVVLTDRYDADGKRQLAHSVRLTAVVRHALEYAAEPVARPELVARLAERFPQAPEDAVEQCVDRLAQHHFLLSDLTPPPDCATPLAHVLTRLQGWEHPVADMLRDVQLALTALDAAPPDDRAPALATATERMRALHCAVDVVQSDLALDVELVLPEEVAREAEHAVHTLWRTSLIRPGSPHLRAYHLAFLERYGTDRAVPVLELLDEGRGLGVPEPYRTRGTVRPEPHPDVERRDRILGELFLDAVHRRPRPGRPTGDGPRGGAEPAEVVLDASVLSALSTDAPRVPPASLELGAELVARDWQQLCAGDFHLVLGANPGSPLAGATFSRFASVLGPQADRIAELVRRGEAGRPPEELAAAVFYRPRVVRSANVATVPQWLPHRIPLGVGPAADGPAESPTVTDLRVENLAVHADLDCLRLIDLTTGRRVRPVSYSMLNPATGHLPQVARFLLELGQEGQDWCIPWNWGAWSAAPAQPRVRHRRTVLSPARWLPDDAVRRAASGDDGDRSFRTAAARWRERWGVPRHVLLTRADNRIAVDLDDALHLLVLREELKRPQGLTVVERYGAEEGDGWLTGPDGAHAAELVLPLVARRGGPAVAERPAPSGRSAPPSVPLEGRGSATHLPGGEWLYAKMYVPAAHQAAVLAGLPAGPAAPALLEAAGVDTWFFLRYADPDPHLRLRFHGKPGQLWPVLLPALNRWAEELRDGGLAQRMVLDTYDPEIERYGGAEVQRYVERVFRTDSEAAVAQLALPGGELDGLTDSGLAALGILGVLAGLGSEEEALEWLGGERVLARRGEVPRAEKKAVADLFARRRGPATLTELWAERARALDALREALTVTGGEGGPRRAQVAMSLAHMHCNRCLGIRQDDEVLAHATAREALSLHLGRKRHGR
ncbi:lantibiotic dehydratase [Streptomyces sp. G6]|uniref:lantibiotic dehydratase n=1 Tax=Streptomyces sp. G6 TaxID=1178736 RepID=UPI003EDA1931